MSSLRGSFLIVALAVLAGCATPPPPPAPEPAMTAAPVLRIPEQFLQPCELIEPVPKTADELETSWKARGQVLAECNERIAAIRVMQDLVN